MAQKFLKIPEEYSFIFNRLQRCIRDRLLVMQEFWYLSSWECWLLTGYMRNMPVSYTHLDVYKRQKLMDESKATGIMTKGPDVNESYLKFSVNPAAL